MSKTSLEKYILSKDLNKCKVVTCKVTEYVKKTYLGTGIVEVSDEEKATQDNLQTEFTYGEISAITAEQVIDDDNNVVTFQIIDTCPISSKTLGLQQKARQRMKLQARQIERVYRNKETERKALEKKEREAKEKAGK